MSICQQLDSPELPLHSALVTGTLPLLPAARGAAEFQSPGALPGPLRAAVPGGAEQRRGFGLRGKALRGELCNLSTIS